MGRKKSKLLRPDPKAKARRFGKLDKEFNCPFCNHDKTIQIKLSHQKGIASLNCIVCTVTFSMEITHLDEAVDVYSEWIDRCMEANSKDYSASKTLVSSSSNVGSMIDKGESVTKQKQIRKMKINEDNEQLEEMFKNDSFDANLNDDDYEEEMPVRKRLAKNSIGGGLFDDD